jgi:hypothetical protein
MATDPIRVDPKHYKVEMENDRVRVLRIRYGPHEKSVMHSHPPSVGVFLNDVHFRFTYPDGKTEEGSAKAGDVMYFDAVEHLPEARLDSVCRRTPRLVRRTVTHAPWSRLVGLIQRTG